MGQKTNPIGFRLGIIRGWDSNWYAEKDFAQKLIEDEEIRNYMKARLKRALSRSSGREERISGGGGGD